MLCFPLPSLSSFLVVALVLDLLPPTRQIRTYLLYLSNPRADLDLEMRSDDR